MPRSVAERVARLVGGVLAAYLGLCPALRVAAEELSLQASFDGRLYVLVEQPSGWSVVEPGSETTRLPGGRGVTFEALAALDGGWLVAGQRPLDDGGGRDVVLLRGGGESRVEALPFAPAGTKTVRSLQPLVEAGKLVGMAWLEGDDPGSLGVRAAAWSGAGFAPADWVAAPTGHSQLALSAAVLEDGGWLLVWSAFDGADDEILWSRHDDAGWSPPARVHTDNRVPDITPAVSATGTGAVCAWSEYDHGTYRVRISRFRAGSWSGEERVGGPGSVFPYFVAEGDRDAPYLVFHETSREGWLLIGLDSGGRIASRSRWGGDGRERPLVRRSGGAMRLEWPQVAVAPGSGGF